jgi:hypothetical protein
VDKASAISTLYGLVIPFRCVQRSDISLKRHNHRDQYAGSRHRPLSRLEDDGAIRGRVIFGAESIRPSPSELPCSAIPYRCRLRSIRWQHASIRDSTYRTHKLARMYGVSKSPRFSNPGMHSTGTTSITPTIPMKTCFQGCRGPMASMRKHLQNETRDI